MCDIGRRRRACLAVLRGAAWNRAAAEMYVRLAAAAAFGKRSGRGASCRPRQSGPSAGGPSPPAAESRGGSGGGGIGDGRRGAATAFSLAPAGTTCTDAGLGVSLVDELPSVALTRRFCPECEHHGSQRLAVRFVAIGRAAGMPGLPANDDWTAWDADQMRTVVDYLEQMRTR